MGKVADFRVVAVLTHNHANLLRQQLVLPRPASAVGGAVPGVLDGHTVGTIAVADVVG